MIRRAVLAFKNRNFLNEFIPVPEELSTAEGPADDTLRRKYGYENWYDFCVSEWGTKWDIGGEDSSITVHNDEHSAYFYFDSAWSPPIAAYEKLRTLGFNIYALYYEPGAGFAGIWDDGYDEYFDIPDSSKACLEQLPEELNKEFAIPEYLAEVEDFYGD
jgi:hypothetical protein